ncbi:MAG: hypothetical protein V4622_00660 [Bacteroidota bacterium]
MKKYIYFLFILLVFSCTKDKVEPNKLPIGYYKITCTYDNGIDFRSGIIKVIETDESKIVIYDDNLNDTLIVHDKKAEGKVKIPSYGYYEIDGNWSFNKKTKDYVIKGKFTKIGYGMGGTLIFYYYGTFEMVKVE